MIPLQCPGLCLCYVILSKLLNVAKHQLHQKQSTDWKHHLLFLSVLSCQSINEVCFWENSNSVFFFFFFPWGTLHSRSWLCCQWLCIIWFPWLESPLWRLGRLGFQGWIVVGLSILGGCCSLCDPTMFLECLLPYAGALSLSHTEPWIQETDFSALPPIFFLIDLSVKLFSQKPITILASLTDFILWLVLPECRGVLYYQHYMSMYLLAQVCTLRIGEGDDRGWDGWMASWTRWTWVWVNSRSWWWTERPGVLWFMESQRVGHSWVTELSWTEGYSHFIKKKRNWMWVK